MANWITPVTNWETIPHFNAQDYNRIVNNLLYLKDLASDLFAQFDYYNMVTEKNFASNLFASSFNAIEQNLEKLNTNTYNLDIGTTKTFAVNQKYPNYEEYNRIEKAELELFSYMWGQLSLLPHLQVKLGGQKEWGRRVHYNPNETIAYKFNFRLGTGKGGIL